MLGTFTSIFVIFVNCTNRKYRQGDYIVHTNDIVVENSNLLDRDKYKYKRVHKQGYD